MYSSSKGTSALTQISNMYSSQLFKSQLNLNPAKTRRLVITVALTLACTASLIWEIFLKVRDDKKAFPL